MSRKAKDDLWSRTEKLSEKPQKKSSEILTTKVYREINDVKIPSGIVNTCQAFAESLKA
jgi:hypothetical protein